jgi:hypothetical protein
MVTRLLYSAYLKDRGMISLLVLKLYVQKDAILEI